MTKEEVREARGKLTQHEFANKIEYSIAAIQRWEQGRGKPSRRAVRAIIRANYNKEG